VQFKVGQLVQGMVVKNQPNKDAYLVLVGAYPGALAVLPKSDASREYFVKDGLLASVVKVGAEPHKLSQKCPFFFKEIARVVLGPVLRPHGFDVWRVAGAHGAPFFKVGIRGAGSDRVIGECLEFEKVLFSYTGKTACFVALDDDDEGNIRRSLLPAPIDSIARCYVYPRKREAHIYVGRSVISQFLGKQGWNVLTAGKLLRWKIVVNEVSRGLLEGGPDVYSISQRV